MTLDPNIPGVAGAIQLAIAPVFLLTAIGAFLNVMAGRLARAVDRARRLEGLLEAGGGEQKERILADLKVLSRRARWANRSISACTGCALLICLEIATVFVGVFFEADVSVAAGLLFLGGIICLILGLVAFLREIFLATQHLTIGSYRPGF